MSVNVKRTDVITFDSWATLKAGKLGLNSGDKIPVTLKTGEEIELVYTRDKNGNGYMVLDNCLFDEHAMNKKNTNKGGWKDCEMRRFLNGTIFYLLPDELQAVIEPTTIRQVLHGEESISEDKLFLLSKTQVFGKGDWSEAEPDDTHLDIFPTERSRVKECGDNGTWWWWLRSPLSSYTTTFCGVYGNGGSTGNGAAVSGGVAFGFSF